MHMKKKTFSTALAAVLISISLSACTSSGSTSSASSSAEATAETTSSPASSAEASSEATAEASAAGTAEASASAETAVSSLQEEFNTYLDAIKDSVFPGSAGSSLNAAYQGADLLTWYVSNKDNVTTDDITSWKDAYVASADDLYSEQLSAVASWISGADSEDSQLTLGDAGWQGDITWTAEDCQTLSAALS
jgi:hypothetical protein